MASADDITQLLAQVRIGDRDAVDRLFPLVYDNLRAVATAYMQQERSDHTLQPTAVINEAFLRLIGLKSVSWKDRGHFIAVAARAMRRILVDHARGRARDKRGGDHERVPFNEHLRWSQDRGVDLLSLDEALGNLATIKPQHARIVELRFFGGLTIEESAKVLGISSSSVEREWRSAKAWLYRELTKGDTQVSTRALDGD